VQFVGLLPSVAASRSALFPLCGGVSVLLGGFLSDKLGANGRNALVVAGMASCTVCLVMLGRVTGHAGAWECHRSGHYRRLRLHCGLALGRYRGAHQCRLRVEQRLFRTGRSVAGHGFGGVSSHGASPK